MGMVMYEQQKDYVIFLCHLLFSACILLTLFIVSIVLEQIV